MTFSCYGGKLIFTVIITTTASPYRASVLLYLLGMTVTMLVIGPQPVFQNG